MRPTLITIITLLSLSGFARADEITLKNGRVLEGRLINCDLQAGKPAVDADTMVTIERPYGLIKVRAAQIVSVKVTDDNLDRFDTLHQEAGSDLLLLLELARWCDDQKLRYRMKEVVAQILELEPDLEDARALIGEVMTDLGWQKAARVKREQKRDEASEGRLIAKAKLRQTQSKMRRLAAQIYSQSAAESKRAYLSLLVLADAENISGLKPIAARFYRDAVEQRAALATGRVTINLQQATVTNMRERSLNLGAGGAVRVQLPETRKIGIGTTVSVPFR